MTAEKQKDPTMFNGINPTSFNKIDRKAEQSAAQQNQLRSNPDGQRRKDNNKPNPQDTPEDLATVSVDSLYLFLQSALPQGKSQAFNAPASQKPAKPQPKSQAARQAANAYARHAKPQAPPANTQTTPRKDISPQDINTIHNLMADLKHLKSKNITRLKIQEGAGFLDSLVRAISRAKSQL